MAFFLIVPPKCFRGGMSLAFFLIVPSVMVVSILLIHALAKRLGLKIYYSTLVATAILSFMIIFAAFILSPVPDKKFFLYLGGLVLVTSFLLTLINNFLIRKQRDEERIFTEQVKAAYAEEIKKDAAKPAAEEIVKPIDKFEWNNETPEPTVEEEPAKENVEPAEKISEPVEKEKSLEEFPLENVFKPLNEVKAEAVAKALQDKSDAPFDEPKPEDNFPLQAVFSPLDETKSEATKKVLQDKSATPFEEPKPEDNFPLQETFKALDEVKPDMLEKIQPEVTPMDLPEKLDFIAEEKFPEPTVEVKPVEEIPELTVEVKPVEEIPEPTVEIKPVEEIPEPTDETIDEENIETLDNILDRAYDARAKGHIWQAMAFYKKALERYNADEYAPFVAIDLGNIYKENALYTKAIKTYEDALELPAVKRNAETKNEFAKNLEYLRVVRDILFKHRAASTPFDKIPKEILQEIDAEFQKTQLHAV